MQDQQLPFTVSSSQRCCLVLIDLQRDFLEPTGRMPIGASRAETVLGRAHSLLAVAKEGQVDLVFVVSAFPSEDRIGNFFRKYSAVKGTPGAQFHPSIVTDGFPVFTKSTSDAFANPELRSHLIKLGIERLAMAGVYAEGCVRATANSGVKLGYKVTVLADAVESDKDWKKRLGLWSMRRNGAAIMTCEGFMAAALV